VEPRKFHAIDLFKLHEIPTLWGRPSKDTFKGKTHEEFYKSRFSNEIVRGLLEVRKGDSSIVLRKGDSSIVLSDEFPDGYFDVIYIDGDHTLEGVEKDSRQAVQKVKRDGYLVFNDYIMFDHIGSCPYGVVHVVNELCVNQGWEIIHFALHEQLFCDVTIRRRDLPH
jgi:methyltransferase family protein